MITVKTPSGETRIHIGENALDAVKTDSLDVCLIADSRVPQAFIERVAKVVRPVHTLALAGGESIKTLEVYGDIAKEMLGNGLSKASLIVAVGGGTLIDMAGFVASTYHRGIPFIAVPTTLLAMVDASVGGKTALNVDHHKNVIGAFHSPSAVHIVPSVLDSLPERELRSGYAEIIKMALLKDRDLFDALQGPHDLTDVIRRSVEIKRDIVERDFRDQGIRHQLNYGHTIGHALEAMHQGKYTHGECVAFGMRKMAKGKPFEKALLDTLAAHQLLIDIPYDKDALIAFIRADKKRRQDIISLAIVDHVGEARVETVPFDTIKNYL